MVVKICTDSKNNEKNILRKFHLCFISSSIFNFQHWFNVLKFYVVITFNCFAFILHNKVLSVMQHGLHYQSIMNLFLLLLLSVFFVSSHVFFLLMRFFQFGEYSSVLIGGQVEYMFFHLLFFYPVSIIPLYLEQVLCLADILYFSSSL